MAAPPYRFNYGEPGHFVEIYLPKKAVYQGPLYETLTKGFDLDVVRKHLTEHETDVKEFLQHHEELRSYTTEQVSRLSPSFNGYSLYELDGVFRSPSMPAPQGELCEERVQVIRLMFLPPENLLAGITDSDEKRQLAARRYIRFWTQNMSEYLADLKRDNRSDDTYEKIAAKLSKWLGDVALFLHGYILFKLCVSIDVLKKNAFIKNHEQEIWLTSFRSLAVVKTTATANDHGNPDLAGPAATVTGKTADTR
jgi:hypothetical protein